MVIINIFLLCVYIILILSNIFIDTTTLGEIWRNVHINSLIGLQKVIEKWELENNLDIQIWYNIMLPILELSILFTLSIIFTILLAFIFLRFK